SLQRQTDADKLLGLMTGELDWIVMKSLDKDRQRRYATAGALAMDVEHYLNDEQVEACPPTAGYRLRKFVRRHKGPVLTAATLLVTLIAGIVGTSWGWVDAVQARAKEADALQISAAALQDKTILADHNKQLAERETDARKVTAKALRDMTILADVNKRLA